MLSHWRSERLRIVLAICRAIDEHARNGKPVCRQFRKFARRWRGAFYRCEPARPIRGLSAERLRKLYYQRWLRSGRNPAALDLQYFTAPPLALSPPQRQQLISVLSDSECCALLPALRGLFGAEARPADKNLLRIFTPRERQSLRRLFAARIAARIAERRFAALVRRGARV